MAVGKRQVLSIGGYDNVWDDQDPAPQGLLLFDMTEMRWKDSYDAEAPQYARPEKIEEWYRNG